MALISFQTPWGIKFLNVLSTGNDYWAVWLDDNHFMYGDDGDDDMRGAGCDEVEKKK